MSTVRQSARCYKIQNWLCVLNYSRRFCLQLVFVS